MSVRSSLHIVASLVTVLGLAGSVGADEPEARGPRRPDPVRAMRGTPESRPRPESPQPRMEILERMDQLDRKLNEVLERLERLTDMARAAHRDDDADDDNDRERRGDARMARGGTRPHPRPQGGPHRAAGLSPGSRPFTGPAMRFPPAPMGTMGGAFGAPGPFGMGIPALPPGRGPEGRGPEGRGPEGRGPEGRGPEGRGPEGRGPEGRGPEGRGPEGRGPEGRGPEGRGPGR